MPRVCLREPLKRLAGDRAEHELAGATVGERWSRWSASTRRSTAGSSTSAA